MSIDCTLHYHNAMIVLNARVHLVHMNATNAAAGLDGQDIVHLQLGFEQTISSGMRERFGGIIRVFHSSLPT